jgi:transcriptional regulator with XRE-family HTH domain
MGKASVSSISKITAAAEMSFDGITQEVIAQRLGLTRSRISQMTSTPTWQQTIARLENLRQKAQAEAEKRQQLLYSAESDRWFDQSRHMVQVCATTYSKLMLAINAGLDAAKNNPDKLEALDQLKNIPSLIKAALSLQQEAFGRHYDEIEALKILAEAGWLPRSVLKLANDETSKLKSNLREAFSGILPDYKEENGRGLTPETAAVIRQHLLGIQPADALEISADVEPGQQPDQDLREVEADRN